MNNESIINNEGTHGTNIKSSVFCGGFFDISSYNLCYRSITWLAFVILADGYLVTSLLNYFTGVWKTRDNSANAAMEFKRLTFIANQFVEFLGQSVADG